MNLSALAAAFPPEAIHWRAQTLTQDGGKALALAYLDARDVMDRLDSVAGPANWSTYNDETPTGRVLCKLSLRIDDEWVTKTDGAGSTAVEGEKGGISDALKRAAVQWGIGRYLYALGNVWAPCDFYEKNGKKHWKAWKPEAQRVFADALSKVGGGFEVKQGLPTGPINDTTRDWLAQQIDATGKPVGDFLTAFSATSLKAITYEQLDEAKLWLRNNRKAA